MSTAVQSGGVSLGQNHAQQGRRSSMLLGSRKSSSATAVSTLTSSSSMSSATSASSACPHTHRQNHNSSKLPTFRSADLLNNGSMSGKPRASALPTVQHCAPDSAPIPGAAGPTPGQGPGLATAPERGTPQGPGQREGSIPPVTDPHHNPPINSAATPAAPGRQSVLHPKQPETPAVAASESTRLPRTRASTFIPSPAAAPSSTPTNNGASSSTTKNQPAKRTLTTKRSSSLPTTSISGVQQHVSPPDNSRVNYSSATSPSAPQSSAPPAPAPASSTTVVPQPADSHATTTTITTAATAETAAKPETSTEPASFSRSHQARRPPLSFGGEPSPNPSTSVGTQRRHTFEGAQDNRASTDRATKHWSSGSGQRELLLPKSLGSTSSDEKSPSVSRRPPPLSYRPPPSLSASQSPATSASASPTVTTPIRVPPIRSFRSSGSRRSLVIDPASRQRALEGSGDEAGNMDSREDTLRALEGRSDDYTGRAPHSGSARPSGGDGDDTTDMFLNIAHEESIRPSIENSPGAVEDHGPIVSSTPPYCCETRLCFFSPPELVILRPPACLASFLLYHLVFLASGHVAKAFPRAMRHARTVSAILFQSILQGMALSSFPSTSGERLRKIY